MSTVIKLAPAPVARVVDEAEAAGLAEQRSRAPRATVWTPVRERLRQITLATRLFLGASVLIVLTLVVAISVASYQAERVADQHIRADLRTVPLIFRSAEESYARAREDQVRGLAQQPGTKALLSEITTDPLTYHDQTAEFARGLGAQVVFIFNSAGELAARSDRPAGDGAGRDFSSVRWVSEPLDRLTTSSAYMLDGSRSHPLLLVAAAPVVQGTGEESSTIGVIAAGFPIDTERIETLTTLVGGDVAYLANFGRRDARDQLSVVASTAGGSAAQLIPELNRNDTARTSLFHLGEPIGPLEVAGTGAGALTVAIPLKSGQDEVVGAFVVARSTAVELAAFRTMPAVLLTTGGLLLLLALPGCFVITRRFTRPLRQLANAAEEIGRGQVDVALPSTATATGEVAALTGAFQLMVSELRAKADLERLVREMQRRPGDITPHAVRQPQSALPAASAAIASVDVHVDTGVDVDEQSLDINASDSGAGARAEVGAGDAQVAIQANAGAAVPAPGHLFALRYEILSCLGEGGMGTVFRVRDRELDQEVALKVLNLPTNPDASLGDAIRHEIKLARLITHSNVVRVHDFGEWAGRNFLTMEYVAGTTLRELLSQRGAFELAPGLQIAKQLCRGLSAVHRAGIIHRDLTPRNVMVMWSGVAKLMDFGVARARTAQGGATYSASAGGTPWYLSPEQARGAELDERSDLYSLGALMFELFTGRVPFHHEEEAELLRMHLTQPPPDPRRLRIGMPALLADLILACLAKSRLERPASAADVERQLMRVRV
jgi:eukaryotic-like serine/threonine-protein kinase